RVIHKDKSVISRKTLEQIAGNPHARQWKSDQQAAAPKKKAAAPKKKGVTAKTPAGKAKTPATGKAAVRKPSADISLPAAGRRAPMPKDLSPMLATLVDKPFDKAGWSYEIKWDGYRALAYLKKGKVELRSRNNKSFEKYYPLYEVFSHWTVDAVLDGEIVVLNEKGTSNFNALQN